MKKFISKKENIEKTLKINELQRLFEFYMVDIAKEWKRTATGQIMVDLSQPHKTEISILSDFKNWMKKEKKYKLKK